MSIFKSVVSGVVAHYKDKQANNKPMHSDYETLINDPLLNDSAYLNYLVDNTKDGNELDAVHEHMNSFNDRVDIYGVKSYMKVSEKIINKKGGW